MIPRIAECVTEKNRESCALAESMEGTPEVVFQTYRWSPAGWGWLRGAGGRWSSTGRAPAAAVRRPPAARRRGPPGFQGQSGSGRRRRAGGDPWRCSRSRSSGLSGSFHPAKKKNCLKVCFSVLSTPTVIKVTSTLSFGLLIKADTSLDGSDFCFTIGILFDWTRKWSLSQTTSSLASSSLQTTTTAKCTRQIGSFSPLRSVIIRSTRPSRATTARGARPIEQRIEFSFQLANLGRRDEELGKILMILVIMNEIMFRNLL